MDRKRYFKIRSLIHNKYITLSNDVRVFGADQRSHFNCIKGRLRVFPFSQHSLQIYCKCYHSNYLLDKITGKNRFNGIIPSAVCGQNVKKIKLTLKTILE